MSGWSNLSKVVYRRTYSRNDFGKLENWEDTCNRAIEGNVRGFDLEEKEIQRLRYFLYNRKATPAGRGLWFSGTPSHEKVGGVALCNCWFTTADDWYNFVVSQSLLMQGGGVGMSVEHRFVSKLPKVKPNVTITHKLSKDADLIVPDSREGWCELTYKVLESFFVTGKGFTYSTICVRGAGERIKGFGGLASGPLPLIHFVEKLCTILLLRERKHIRPIDALDILCCIGEMVVSGNVRRSAIIILGDPWDKEYLCCKRWDLKEVPTQRAMANMSVVCDDVDDLHPSFWKTYEHGEPFGIVNRTNIHKYGRMGELLKDTAIGVNPCGEATLEGSKGGGAEPCNLQELFLPRFEHVNEFFEGAVLMHRWGKRVCLEDYHNPRINEIIKRNMRIGTGITGCLQSKLFTPEILDVAYASIQEENERYSKTLGVNKSIRTTVVKPSGTLSLLGGVSAGIHPSFSRFAIRRIRFSSNDPLIPKLKEAGHHVEPVKRFDGGLDHGTLVVDFYVESPEGTPVADEDWDTWKQLEVLKMAQKHWADQAVSVTVYYQKQDIPKIKEWLAENLSEIKTISFLCHNDHGFDQAPWEAISQAEYEKLNSKITTLEFDDVVEGSELDVENCEGGHCPTK